MNDTTRPDPADEPRFPYDGPGGIEPPAAATPQRIVLVTTDAALPQLAQNPEVTRTEYEFIAANGGWSRHPGFLALGGWKRRLADVVARHDQAYVVGPRWDMERIAAIRDVLSWNGGSGAFYTSDDDWQTPNEQVADAACTAVRVLTARGSWITALTLVMDGDRWDAGEVRDDLLQRIDGITVEVRAAHPVLGVLSGRLPMPSGLEALGDAVERGLARREPQWGLRPTRLTD